MMWTIRGSHRSWFLGALVGLAFCLLGLGLAGCSYPPPTVATPGPSSTVPPLTAMPGPMATRTLIVIPTSGLSTPRLIELAFQKGEITNDQRVLYLVYALFEPSRLPPQFISFRPWEGTPYVDELSKTASSADKMCKLSVSTQAELRKFFQDEAVKCGN